jgi:hypothetical protein
MKTLLRAALALALAAVPMLGQSVHGIVRDSTSAQPLAGAVVGLLDASGTALIRIVTNERGQYRLPRPGAANHVRVVRIGFRPVEVPLAAGGDVVVDIRMASIPHFLEAVRVTGNQKCAKRSDAAAAFALWEQARAGLLATVVGRETNPPTMVRAGFERTMEGNSDRIEEQSVRIDSAEVSKSFTAVLSAEGFIKFGFVKDSAGKQIYYGPDADILLDQAFTSGYCFSIRDRDVSRPTQIGLGFTPADRQRGRIDIDGTLWVDTSARAIKDLEFQYLRLGSQYDRFHPGGHVWFAAMPNGQVLIDRWNMRLVSAGHDTVWGRTNLPNVREYLYAREPGGELVSATWPDSTTWHASLGTLYIHAVDANAMPASHFVLRLENTDYIASPDARGDLEIRDLLPGPYHAVVVDSTLATLGITMPTSLRFVAQRDSISEHRLLVPDPADFIRRDCDKAAPLPDGGSMVVIRAMTDDGKPVVDANWQVSRDFGVSRQPILQTRRTTGDGILHHCLQVRPGDALRIHVWRDGEDGVVLSHTVMKPLEAIRITLPAKR